MSGKTHRQSNANLLAVIGKLQAQLQSMEEKIKSQDEEIKRLRNKTQKKQKLNKKKLMPKSQKCFLVVLMRTGMMIS
jgi:molecular chaperone GrpE (heat shock protein)